MKIFFYKSICFCSSLFLIYLKWFHKIDVKYSSIGLFDAENLAINHQLFSIHIKHINFLSSFSIFIWRLPVVLINNIHLNINSIQKSISNTNKSKTNWKKILYVLKVNLSIE